MVLPVLRSSFLTAAFWHMCLNEEVGRERASLRTRNCYVRSRPTEVEGWSTESTEARCGYKSKGPAMTFDPRRAD